MDSLSLEHLFSQAPVAVCIVSGEKYKVEVVNESMLSFLGRTAAIIGHPIGETLTEIKEQGLLSILDRVWQTGQPFSVSNFPAVIIINGIRETRYFNLVFKPYFLQAQDAKPDAIFCVAHNVTAQVLALQSLEEERRRTALALDTGGLGVIATDWKNNVVKADQRANEIFDVPGELSLQEYVSRIHPDDRKLREEAVRQGLESGSFDFEARLLVKDGIRWMRSRGMVQKNADGQVMGTFGVVQDITAQKEFSQALHNKVEERTAELAKATASLLKANEELVRSNQSLEEFTRAASHDLKEPVRKMRVFASRLHEMLDERLSGEEKSVFLRLENAAERMGLLVDDLLAYSQVGQAAAELEAVDLNDKIQHILEDLELLVLEKQAVFRIEELPTVNGYRRQLQQLFQNLLTNALKYSRAGVPPEVIVRAKKIKGNESTAALPPSALEKIFHLIEVCDNGIGFNQRDAERIFQVFTRLHGNKEYTGSGIGLSIAKKVMENHNGYIYAQGEAGKGACFGVLFPVEATTE